MIGHNYAERVIENVLCPEERLLWAGQPPRGVMFEASDVLLIPFSIIWASVAILGEASAIVKDEPIYAKLWAGIFVLLGAYLLVGRYILDDQRRAKTWYGVTDQRIIIVSDLFGRKIDSFKIAAARSVTLSEKKDRRGTIKFGAILPRVSVNSPGSATARVPMFESIYDAKDVYEIIVNLRGRKY